MDGTPEGFFDWMIRLRDQVGIPAGLKSLGVDPKHLDDLVAVAVADGCHACNPFDVTEADFRTLFQEAMTK